MLSLIRSAKFRRPMKRPIRPIMLSDMDSQIPRKKGIGHEDHQQDHAGDHQNDAQAGLALQQVLGPGEYAAARGKGFCRGGKLDRHDKATLPQREQTQDLACSLPRSFKTEESRRIPPVQG